MMYDVSHHLIRTQTGVGSGFFGIQSGVSPWADHPTSSRGADFGILNGEAGIILGGELPTNRG